MNSANQLKAGSRISITYKEGVIHEIKEPPLSMEEFANKYDLNLEDLLTLNYIEDPKATLQVGQQIFLDLNRFEAEEKGLVEKREFQALDLGDDNSFADSDVQPIAMNMPNEKPADNAPQGEDDVLIEQAPWVDDQQQVITAEQTEKHLKNLTSQKEQAKVAQEEAQKAAERNAQKQQEQTEAKKAAGAAAVAKAQAESEKINQLETQKQEEAGIVCDANQCLQDGKCWTRPENAYCSPEDPKNAWICKEGFTDTGKSCVPQEAEKPAPKKASLSKKI